MVGNPQNVPCEPSEQWFLRGALKSCTTESHIDSYMYTNLSMKAWHIFLSQGSAGLQWPQHVHDLCTEWLCLYFLCFYPAEPSVPSAGHKGSEHSGKIVCTLAFLFQGKETKQAFFLFPRSISGLRGLDDRSTVSTS